MRPRKLAAIFAFPVLAALAQEIPVNYPSTHGVRFVSLSLDGFPEHVYEVQDHGATVKMKGLRLGHFLRAAGWERYARSEGTSYRVRIQGRGHAATFDLADIEHGSFRQQVLLVRERDGKRIPWEDRPLLVVIDEDGVVTETVPGVISVRVF
jgi:hypothetical protein